MADNNQNSDEFDPTKQPSYEEGRRPSTVADAIYDAFTGFNDPNEGMLARAFGLADSQSRFGVRPKTAEEYFAESEGRQRQLQDLSELRRLQRVGGPASQAAAEQLRRQTAGQLALARSGGGGAALRRGTQAAGQAQLEGQAQLNLIREAERQGYAQEEAQASAMLAMSDNEFRRMIDTVSGDIGRGEAQAKQEAKGGILSKVGSVLSSIASFSDKNTKENIRPLDANATRDFLEKMSAGSFNYRPEFGGGPERVGPLLDERVERTQIGRSITERDPATGMLRVNTVPATMATLAMLQQQNERLNELEKKKGGK
mgnify:CR=1 FL=1